MTAPLIVRPAEFEGAVRLAVAHGMTVERARAAAEQLYRVDRRRTIRTNVPAAVGGRPGASGGGER